MSFYRVYVYFDIEAENGEDAKTKAIEVVLGSERAETIHWDTAEVKKLTDDEPKEFPTYYRDPDGENPDPPIEEFPF